MGRLPQVYLLALALAVHAQAPSRGDRYVNAGQGTERATDKCTFVYKARGWLIDGDARSRHGPRSRSQRATGEPCTPAPLARALGRRRVARVNFAPHPWEQGKKQDYTYKLQTKVSAYNQGLVSPTGFYKLNVNGGQYTTFTYWWQARHSARPRPN